MCFEAGRKHVSEPLSFLFFPPEYITFVWPLFRKKSDCTIMVLDTNRLKQNSIKTISTFKEKKKISIRSVSMSHAWMTDRQPHRNTWQKTSNEMCQSFSLKRLTNWKCCRNACAYFSNRMCAQSRFILGCHLTDLHVPLRGGRRSRPGDSWAQPAWRRCHSTPTCFLSTSTAPAGLKRRRKTKQILFLKSAPKAKSEVGGLLMLKYQFSSLNSNNLKVNSYIWEALNI